MPAWRALTRPRRHRRGGMGPSAVPTSRKPRRAVAAPDADDDADGDLVTPISGGGDVAGLRSDVAAFMGQLGLSTAAATGFDDRDFRPKQSGVKKRAQEAAPAPPKSTAAYVPHVCTQLRARALRSHVLLTRRGCARHTQRWS